MNGMRVPVVAGVGGGVGTTTVAVGLRGHDAGRVAGPRPDLLVCRATLDSLRRAAAVLDGTGPEPPPVLAVTLAERAPRRPLRAQLDLLEADAAALVLLPHVPRWCTLVDPLAEAAQLLVEPAAQLPRPLRAYAAALRELVAAVAASGRLGHGSGDGPVGSHRVLSIERPPRPESHGPAGPNHVLSNERPPRPESHGPRATGAARPQAPGAFRPVEGIMQRGAGPVGLLPAAPVPHGGLAPAAPDPGRMLDPSRRRRAGVRIVAPTEARPAGGRAPGTTAVQPPGPRAADVTTGRVG